MATARGCWGVFCKANAKREDTVVATKLNGVMRDGPNGGGLSRKEIFFELDESLRRLETDYVDLYQIHRWDKTTPIEETLEALNDVVRAGKVRYIGASSMWAWQFSKALYTSEKHGWAKFVSMQPHYNLLYREEEREMLKLCVDQGVGVIPWSPLARGQAGATVGGGDDEAVGVGRVWQVAVHEDGGSGPAGGGAGGEGCGRSWGSDGAGGVGVAADQAGDYGADCGRDQVTPSAGCGRGGRVEADGR